MTLKLSFKLDNDAFVDSSEVSRILREAADYVEWQLQDGHHFGFGKNLLDDNGNTVGTISLL